MSRQQIRWGCRLDDCRPRLGCYPIAGTHRGSGLGLGVPFPRRPHRCRNGACVGVWRRI